jgi:hypothetical protein
MSEYQYYEFQAIDRPLTAKEMVAPALTEGSGLGRELERALTV